MAVHRVAVLALDGVIPLDLAIPMQVFGARADTPYEVALCGPTERVATTSGFGLAVDAGLERVRAADTVIVPGFEPHLQSLSNEVLGTIAEACDRGRRVISICLGTFALAGAGVLDGLHATTHWQHIDDLEQGFPAVHVDRDVLYVDEGNVLTSAGMCCGIDLCLHVVRRDLGAAVANQIARTLVAAPHRDGGQAQYVPAAVPAAGSSSLSGTRAWALERVGETLTIAEMARHAGTSQRSFMRKFTEETGDTPLQWLLAARIGRARELLETTDFSVDRVARECGLGTAANLRLHFHRALATTPTAYRRAFTH